MRASALGLVLGLAACQTTPDRPGPARAVGTHQALPWPATSALAPGSAQSSAAAPVSAVAASASASAPAVPFPPPPIVSIDTVMQAFLQEHRLPGLSVALSRKGKLVHAKGYGLADREQSIPVTTDHLFRVASVSKPITSVAVLKLVEQGKLALDSLVFGSGGVLASHFTVPAQRARLTRITVRHLLTHTAGWLPSRDGDPMFERTELDTHALIQYALEVKPIAFEPGTHYDYSNFSFCVLGRVIEAASGLDYSSFVRTAVLGPSGATNMLIGADTRAQRHPKEVLYYPSPGDSDPYALLPSRMDSHGGWIASAIDLVRFLVHVDGFPDPPDVLRPATLEMMTTATPVKEGIALGWLVNKHNNWWHMGAMPGTSSMVARTSGEYCWAILVNTWNRSNSKYLGAIDGLLWRAIESVSEWPPGAAL